MCVHVLNVAVSFSVHCVFQSRFFSIMFAWSFFVASNFVSVCLALVGVRSQLCLCVLLCVCLCAWSMSCHQCFTRLAFTMRYSFWFECHVSFLLRACRTLVLSSALYRACDRGCFSIFLPIVDVLFPAPKLLEVLCSEPEKPFCIWPVFVCCGCGFCCGVLDTALFCRRNVCANSGITGTRAA